MDRDEIKVVAGAAFLALVFALAEMGIVYASVWVAFKAAAEGNLGHAALGAGSALLVATRGTSGIRAEQLERRSR